MLLLEICYIFLIDLEFFFLFGLKLFNYFYNFFFNMAHMAHIHWISLVDQTIKHSSLEKKEGPLFRQRILLINMKGSL
jgi:hypothetical protein